MWRRSAGEDRASAASDVRRSRSLGAGARERVNLDEASGGATVVKQQAVPGIATMGRPVAAMGVTQSLTHLHIRCC